MWQISYMLFHAVALVVRQPLHQREHILPRA